MGGTALGIGDNCADSFAQVADNAGRTVSPKALRAYYLNKLVEIRAKKLPTYEAAYDELTRRISSAELSKLLLERFPQYRERTLVSELARQLGIVCGIHRTRMGALPLILKSGVILPGTKIPEEHRVTDYDKQGLKVGAGIYESSSVFYELIGKNKLGTELSTYKRGKSDTVWLVLKPQILDYQKPYSIEIPYGKGGWPAPGMPLRVFAVPSSDNFIEALETIGQQEKKDKTRNQVGLGDLPTHFITELWVPPESMAETKQVLKTNGLEDYLPLVKPTATIKKIKVPSLD